MSTTRDYIVPGSAMPPEAFEEIPVFQPSRERIDLDGPNNRTVTSWLVSRHGKALFVSECQPFVRWFIENNPGAVVEDVTKDVPSALARTAA